GRTRFCEPLKNETVPVSAHDRAQGSAQSEPVSAGRASNRANLFLRDFSQKQVRRICKPSRQAFGQ
ncbi:hypothetical protein, partial [Ralstonia pickettii]|uniref:hypothetical protein n=1 Tax=Ralstonia pickettii TaxID=329 RepID=UPI001BAF96E9